MRRLVAGVVLAMAASCERRAPETRRADSCPFTRADTMALATAARDTMMQLKGHAQRVTEVTPARGGIAFRTEDTDSSAFHNGGAVSFDCARRITAVWLDGG